MSFDASDLKTFLKVLSAIVGLCLLSISIAGFHHLTQTTGSFEGQASLGCMCFLGVIFGLILFLGESKWEVFFFFFGFMRYRIGRAIVLLIAGVMIAIMGKNMNSQCDCQKFILLIIQGAACLGVGVLQVIGVFVFENNTVTQTTATQTNATSCISTVQSPSTSVYIPPTPITKPPSPVNPVINKKNETAHQNDSNLPSWMQA